MVAIPFALITILLLPGKFRKNRLETVSVEPADKISKNTIQYYHDLNNDSIDEIISQFENDANQCALKIIVNQRENPTQWNFNGTLPPKARSIAYLDYNHDGTLDVFTFFQRQDSLFVGGVNMLVDSAKLVDEVFIDKIRIVNGTTNFNATLYNYDLNTDGYDELVITINAGYSEVPRRIYAWDYRAGKMLKSPLVGFRNSDLEFVDLDGDGFVEIIPCTMSYENIEKGLGIQYNDYERWWVIYNHKLQFEFEPVNFGRGSGSVNKFVVNGKDGPQVYLLDHSDKSGKKFRYFRFDVKTARIKEMAPFYAEAGRVDYKPLYLDKQQYVSAYQKKQGRFIVLDAAADFKVVADEIIDPGMSFRRAIEIKSAENPIVIFNDLTSEKNYLRFFELNSLSELVRYPFADNREIKHICTYTTPDRDELIDVQVGEDIASLRYVRDPWFLVKNIAVILIVFGFYTLLIWLILRLQHRMLREHYKREQIIAELKLKSIRNQLDPHFTFNAVNAIASAIYKEDKETAYKYFSLFSKMLRSTMLYSDRMSRSLRDELEFTVQYLDIELFRYRDKFVYHFDVDDQVNENIQVPRMIIQTFAESAVTNGLMHRQSGGKLNVRIRPEGNELEVVFEDNGVGIEQSSRLNKARAFKSIRIMDEFIRLFNELNHTNIRYEMKDINPAEEYPGTRVIVRLPVVFKYRGSSGEHGEGL